MVTCSERKKNDQDSGKSIQLTNGLTNYYIQLDLPSSLGGDPVGLHWKGHREEVNLKQSFLRGYITKTKQNEVDNQESASYINAFYLAMTYTT